jgi:2-polyprenyl-6-methoxyphenol hydroxylase-like FAD-dependent oxidoreductase
MVRVLVAGCGIAAGAMALRALKLGIEPVLLETTQPAVDGIEIIPASARHLLAALGLDEILAAIRPGLATGMSRRLPDGQSHTIPGRALHVSRLALRNAIIEEARRRGTNIIKLDRLPPIDRHQFSIDATGRAAAWSQPVIRYGRGWADIYSTMPFGERECSRVGPLRQGWAYTASDRNQATIVAINAGKRAAGELEAELRQLFEIPNGTTLRQTGRRLCFPQAAIFPMRGRCIAIGDAAFTHDPIGGRGISFALGSAFTAGFVLETWRDRPEDGDLAAQHYCGYVEAEIARHLRFLAGDRPSVRLQELPSRVIWSACEIRCPVVARGRIVKSDAVLIPGDVAVRWLGRVDIMDMRALCHNPVNTSDVIKIVSQHGVSEQEATAAVTWAVHQGVLSGV